MTCPMNCLIGKDFIGDGSRPPDSPTMMGSYGVLIIINAAHEMAEWNHINANCAVIKEERGKKQKYLAEHGLQRPLLPLRVQQALRICLEITLLHCWQGQEVNEEGVAGTDLRGLAHCYFRLTVAQRVLDWWESDLSYREKGKLAVYCFFSLLLMIIFQGPSTVVWWKRTKEQGRSSCGEAVLRLSIGCNDICFLIQFFE